MPAELGEAAPAPPLPRGRQGFRDSPAQRTGQGPRGDRTQVRVWRHREGLERPGPQRPGGRELPPACSPPCMFWLRDHGSGAARGLPAPGLLAAAAQREPEPLTTSSPGNVARPLASIASSISCMASRSTNLTDSLADSGNIWQRLYSCLSARKTGPAGPQRGSFSPGPRWCVLAAGTRPLPHSPAAGGAACLLGLASR